jgi:hypothetical protein
MATSKVSQLEGNDHPDSMGMARFHTNQGNLRIVLAHVEDCELPKYFIGRPNGDRALRRPFIGDGSSRTSCSVPSWAVKYVNLNVWLDVYFWRSEISTHGGWWGGLCLCGDIQSNPSIVVDSIIARVIIAHVAIAHVEVPQILWLTLRSMVFDGWGHILPVFFWPINTSSQRELDTAVTCVLVNRDYHDVNNTDHGILHYIGMTIRLAGNWQRVGRGC